MGLITGTDFWYARNGVWQRRGRSSHVAGIVMPGYYLKSNADIGPDTTTYNMNLKGHTAYTSWAQGVDAFPISSWCDTLSRNGYLINYVWEPKVYSGTQLGTYAAPNATMNNWPGGVQFYGWTQVTSGTLDPLFADVAAKVKTLPYNINIQICSERDTDHYTGGIINGVSYTWAQLDTLSVSGVAYIINYFKNAGVTNATFSAGMGGFNQAAFDRCYCSAVDIIQYNAYNHNGWQTPDDVFGETYAWLSDLPGESASRPVWIAEWGCDTDARRPAYFAAVPAAIAQLSRIKYMSYFNANWGEIPISDTASMNALAACYEDPLFGGDS
jgi:hypothetical protein